MSAYYMESEMFGDGDYYGSLVSDIPDGLDYQDEITKRDELTEMDEFGDEQDETCDHGLSLWLCADPINHYPADNAF